MLVSDIITAARQYTQISGSQFFNATDELRAVNRAYRDIYERICNANDDYFLTELIIDPATFTDVREGVHDYTLPADFYRLRNLVGVTGSGDVQFARKDVQDIYLGEGYRFYGQKLRVFYTSGYSSFRLEYYPEPVEFTSTATAITYPPQLEPLIIAYQLAMDIAKMQNADAAKHAEEYARLWKRFEIAITNKDNLRYVKVANKYRSTFPGY